MNSFRKTAFGLAAVAVIAAAPTPGQASVAVYLFFVMADGTKTAKVSRHQVAKAGLLKPGLRRVHVRLGGKRLTILCRNRVCRSANGKPLPSTQWLGSRVISFQKANINIPSGKPTKVGGKAASLDVYAKAAAKFRQK